MKRKAARGGQLYSNIAYKLTTIKSSLSTGTTDSVYRDLIKLQNSSRNKNDEYIIKWANNDLQQIINLLGVTVPPALPVISNAPSSIAVSPQYAPPMSEKFPSIVRELEYIINERTHYEGSPLTLSKRTTENPLIKEFVEKVRAVINLANSPGQSSRIALQTLNDFEGLKSSLEEIGMNRTFIQYIIRVMDGLKTYVAPRSLLNKHPSSRTTFQTIKEKYNGSNLTALINDLLQVIDQPLISYEAYMKIIRQEMKNVTDKKPVMSQDDLKTIAYLQDFTGNGAYRSSEETGVEIRY